MPKPYGRKTKKKVGQILDGPNRIKALEALEQIPDEQLVGHLFSYFYNPSPLIKFRSISAMGYLGRRISQINMEKARVILRRIMWNLNDESGGIGWGSPEAMGEILSRSRKLAIEFKSILFSYLDPKGNYLEHGELQKGVLWGIGTYLEAAPGDLTQKTRELLFGYLHSNDPVKRGYAVRALIHAGEFDCRIVPEKISSDSDIIDIFTGWNFVPTRISDMALACENHNLRMQWNHA